MTREKEIDDLYALPLGTFVSERDALSRRHQKDGDRAAAKEIKELAKPTKSAWAINQLARSESKGVKRLLEAGEKLRRAQEGVLGGGSPEKLREASVDLREVIAGLAESASQILERAGDPATEAVLDRVRTTLRAAAVEDEGRHLLETGRLTRDLGSSGFDVLATLSPASPPKGAKAASEPSTAPTRRQDAKRVAAEAAVADLRSTVRELRQAVRKAEAEAQKARRSLEEAERVVAGVRGELERGEARLERAEAKRRRS